MARRRRALPAVLLAGVLLAACGTQGSPLSATQRARARTACRAVAVSTSPATARSAPGVGTLVAEGLATGVPSIQVAARWLRRASSQAAMQRGDAQDLINAIVSYEDACRAVGL
jgi:hypothetical protein